MSDALFFYAMALAAETDDSLGVVVELQRARNDDEAKGIAWRRCREKYPVKDGWKTHSTQEMRVDRS